jgi:hypothetical protein
MRNATIAAHDGQVWPALRELARGGVPADGNE